MPACAAPRDRPYAAGNLLKLIGRYDYLGLDSWVRAQWTRLHARENRSRTNASKSIIGLSAAGGDWCSG